MIQKEEKSWRTWLFRLIITVVLGVIGWGINTFNQKFDELVKVIQQIQLNQTRDAEKNGGEHFYFNEKLKQHDKDIDVLKTDVKELRIKK